MTVQFRYDLAGAIMLEPFVGVDRSRIKAARSDRAARDQKSV